MSNFKFGGGCVFIVVFIDYGINGLVSKKCVFFCNCEGVDCVDLENIGCLNFWLCCCCVNGEVNSWIIYVVL